MSAGNWPGLGTGRPAPATWLGAVRLQDRRPTGGGNKTDMFDKASLDQLFEELRDEFELETDWEDIQRDAHLAVAFADAGTLDDQKGSLDARIVEFVERHNPG